MSETTSNDGDGEGVAEDVDLDAFLGGLVASRTSRHQDWDTLAFQQKAGEQFRRAQVRYIGSGATGDHDGDQRILASEHFTFSNMLLPPGGEGPEHVHHDAEEVFFVLEGELDVSIHRGATVATRRLGYRDLIKIPPGVPRSLRNAGEGDALFCVVIGARKPALPSYPETSPMHRVHR